MQLHRLLDKPKQWFGSLPLIANYRAAKSLPKSLPALRVQDANASFQMEITALKFEVGPNNATGECAAATRACKELRRLLDSAVDSALHDLATSVNSRGHKWKSLHESLNEEIEKNFSDSQKFILQTFPLSKLIKINIENHIQFTLGTVAIRIALHENKITAPIPIPVSSTHPWLYTIGTLLVGALLGAGIGALLS